MKCPVICNNTGGTHELVRPSGGIVLDIDAPYNYEPTNLYATPKIDRKLVAYAMYNCILKRPTITYDHVHIDTVANKYHQIFKEALC
jgi:hypothetical protein